MPIAAVLFDLDGTLVDTNALHVAAWERAFARLGPPVAADRLRPLIGMGGDKLVPAVAGDAVEADHGKPLRKAHEEEYAVGSKAATPVPVFPGAAELVRAVRDSGRKAVLATSSGQAHLKATAAACGTDFTKLMDAAADGDDAAESKPAPDLIQAAVKKAGVPAAECVLVGDTPFDGEAARKAGVMFWGVTCGGLFSADQLERAGAVAVWADPAALLAELPRLLSAD